MKKIAQDFLLMVQFLTRIPIKMNLPCHPSNFNRGALFMPIVGLLIGMIQYIIAFLLYPTLPASVLAAILVVFPIVITGGLHMDGLGDTCDGFFAFKGDSNKIIEIMKDSSSGTYAICGVVCNILLQYGTIKYLLEQNSFKILILIIMFSKLFVLFTAAWGTPAKKNGSGNLFIGNISTRGLIIATSYSLCIGLRIIPFHINILLLASGSMMSILFYLLCKAKISGITGDTLGATQEIATITMLVVYCTTI